MEMVIRDARGLLLSTVAALAMVLGGSIAQAAPTPAAPIVAAPSATTPAKPGVVAPVPATPSTPAPAPVSPDRTAEMFGDWTLMCVRSGDQKACEVNLAVQDRQKQIGATLAIGTPAGGKVQFLIARLPVNVTTSQPARLVLEGDGEVLLPLRNCIPAGCFAQLELTDETILKRMRARDAGTGHRLDWTDAAGAGVGLSVSLRGIGNALSAMAMPNRP